MTDREMLTSAMNEQCTPTPCPVCGRKPGAGYINESPCYSFSCSGSWEEPHGTLSGGRQRTVAAAERRWNEAAASYRPPAPEPEPDDTDETLDRFADQYRNALESMAASPTPRPPGQEPGPEPEPVTPRRWHYYAIVKENGDYYAGLIAGEDSDAALEAAFERHGLYTGDGLRFVLGDITPSRLAEMLAESRAWYAKELERSQGVPE